METLTPHLTTDPGWIPDPARDFGARLALVRQHRAWNVTEAARESGVDAESWRRWENDGRRPRDYETVCRKVSAASGCSLIWLMVGRVGLPTSDGRSAAQVTPQKVEWTLAA